MPAKTNLAAVMKLFQHILNGRNGEERERESIKYSPLNPALFWSSSPAMAISEITPLPIRPDDDVASAANDVDIGDRKEAIITRTATENSISIDCLFADSVQSGGITSRLR